ncbi:DUF4232 domain-containing protein [Streptomyces sp. NPDC050617]|uniref:DUF4232 domain-containing protein n=1 Tax=Streptomyces sp. NPDC050617 TaxID=3154628 RepID=UPI003415077C
MRRMTTVATAAAAAALLAGGIAAGTANAAAPTATATPTCAVSGLRITLDDNGDGGSQHGMNHEGTYLRFKNTTGTTCALRGYPGLGLEKAGHAKAATDVKWGSTYFAQDPGKKTVYLKSGASAWADLVWTHTGANAVHAKYLEVTPPAATTHRTLAFDKIVDNGTLNVTSLSATPPTAG